MPNQKKGVRVVKGWAVTRGKRLETDYAFQYEFEGVERGDRSNIYLMCTSERQAKNWIKKWLGGTERMRVLPCTITYTLPTNRKKK